MGIFAYYLCTIPWIDNTLMLNIIPSFIKVEKIKIEHHSERIERYVLYSIRFTENLWKKVALVGNLKFPLVYFSENFALKYK